MWKLRLEEIAERRLVAKAIGGDRDAGEQIVRKHYASVYSFMLALTHDREVSEELVQATFASAWQSLAGFRHESALKTWLHQIAHRQFLGWSKKRVHSGESQEGVGKCPESGIIDALWIEQAIGAMPNSLAEPFVLHYIQQIPVNDVAQILGIKRGTVLSRLFTARQLMRKLMLDGEQALSQIEFTDKDESNSERSQYEMSKASI